jgi:SAM-dependent methyltransferase
VAATYAELLPDTRYESPLELGLVDHFIGQLSDSPLPVLDAGCGTGRMLTYLDARGVANLAGVDLSPEMLAFARESHPHIPLQQADLRSLPFADASVRAILCWYAIIHSSRGDVATIVREVARLLAPGGIVLFGFQAGVGEREVERAYGHSVTLRGVLHEPHDIAQLLRAEGLDVTAVVDRAPVGAERNRQGFVMARRSSAAVTRGATG